MRQADQTKNDKTLMLHTFLLLWNDVSSHQEDLFVYLLHPNAQ
jgi:hypothetical protein